MHSLTTLFDKHYLSRALVMLHSLAKHVDELELFVLALDEEVVSHFNNHKYNFKITTIQLASIEKYFPKLKEAKQNRSKVEYIFTLSPFLPLYVLKNFGVKRITSLDADLCFYSNPFTFIEKHINESIFITPHSFSKEHTDKEIYGKYNVSFQSFPATENGFSCLTKWASNCIEYCGDEIDDKGRFADQKYLDTWKNEFSNVEELPSNKGYGIAPWNISEANISEVKNKWLVGQTPLVFYHFQGFREITRRFFASSLHLYKLDIKKNRCVKKLYANYWRDLKHFNTYDNRIVHERTTYSTETKFGIPKMVLHNPFAFILLNRVFYKNAQTWYKHLWQK